MAAVHGVIFFMGPRRKLGEYEKQLEDLPSKKLNEIDISLSLLLKLILLRTLKQEFVRLWLDRG